MSADSVVILSAVVGLAAYLSIHFIVFRFLEAKGIIQGLMNVYFIGAIVTIVCFGFLSYSRTDLITTGGMGTTVFCGLVSFVVYSLMCYFYVLYIFGIYESSIRIRIMREFYKALPKGLTLSELLACYNADFILRTRLERLVGSGEVTFDGVKYRIGKCPFIFLMLDYMACAIKKIMGSR